MGLDMYLNKSKRIHDATVEEIVRIDQYLDWKDQNNRCTLLEWCGIQEDEINKDLASLYVNEFQIKYDAWDDEKKYVHKSIIASLGYWRKANHIHKWFVDNVQNSIDDCSTYEVSKDQLEELLALCKHVIKNSQLIEGQVKNGEIFKNGEWVSCYEKGYVIENNLMAKTLLPTQSGFFFGSTEYDQWYLEDIQYTVSVLEEVLNDTDFDQEVVMYRSSW